jgi:hypothetical protein
LGSLCLLSLREYFQRGQNFFGARVYTDWLFLLLAGDFLRPVIALHDGFVILLFSTRLLAAIF